MEADRPGKLNIIGLCLGTYEKAVRAGFGKYVPILAGSSYTYVCFCVCVCVCLRMLCVYIYVCI